MAIDRVAQQAVYAINSLVSSTIGTEIKTIASSKAYNVYAECVKEKLVENVGMESFFSDPKGVTYSKIINPVLSHLNCIDEHSDYIKLYNNVNIDYLPYVLTALSVTAASIYLWKQSKLATHRLQKDLHHQSKPGNQQPQGRRHPGGNNDIKRTAST